MAYLFVFAEEENGFFFGLATAPAHVEDRLDDAWIQFAEQESVAGAEQKVDALMGSATADGESQQAISSAQRGLKGNKKSLKVAMEAMIRGFEKYMEVDGQEGEEEHIPNVTAWHNVPHP
jgi:galactolipid galactosyltransferase